MKEKNYRQSTKTVRVISRILRWTILGGLLIFVLSATTLNAMGYAAPSIHAICPYGGVESLLSFVTFGVFVKKIFLGTFVLFAATMAIAVIFRRSFCGQICAFGGLQEFLGNLGRKIFKKRRQMPVKLDRILRYLKYVVLIVTAGMAWITAELWIIPYDPFNALGHLADFNSLITTYLIGFIVLIITLLGSLVYERFFCKYLCPAGALYGIIGKISPYAVRRNDDKCIKCSLCNKACPVNVDVMGAKAKNGKVSDIECINCNECVHVCPIKGALSTGFGKRGKIHPIVATLLVATLFFAPILIARSAGSFQILPNKFITGGSSGNEEDHEEDEDSAGTDEIAAGDIKGYMTLKDIADILDMTIDEIYAKLGLADDFPESYTIKTAGQSVGADFDEFKQRLFE